VASPVDKPLYDELMSRLLQQREASAERENREKADLLLAHIGPCNRLVDIGCGWGQFLRAAAERVDEVWGVDESPDRVADVAVTCPNAKVIVCKADHLDLPDGYFDSVVMSQMLHEVVLFGKEAELEAALREIHRILVDKGRYLLLDHFDADDGQVTVRLPQDATALLAEFERKYRYYRAGHADRADGTVRIPKRCLQDFLTKIWALNTAMESMEMEETHNVFERESTIRLVEQAGFVVNEWIPFVDICTDLERVGGKLVDSKPWFRKFLLVASRSG